MKKYKNKITLDKIFALALFTLSGCATGYHSSGFSGGFTETQLSENVYRVTFNGNGYTGDTRAQDLSLLRAADLTLQSGYRYFGLMDSSNQKSYGAVVAPSQTYYYGNTATTYGGGVTFISKPSSTNIVIMLNEKDGGAFIFDANFICESIGYKYKIKCGEKIKK